MEWSKLLSEARLRPPHSGVATDDEDPRTEFQRDYSKAIFSTPVRRLQDKAQVFPLEPNDAVRTRLTHSMEVSGLAQDIAGSVGEWLLSEQLVSSRQAQAIRDIAKTCGLIHDIGNPPFGHAGELAITTWFSEGQGKDAIEGLPVGQLKQDLLNFDGNAQTMRLLLHLSILTDYYGFNLTCGTLSAAAKYLARSDETNSKHEMHKPGYFASENDAVALVRQITGTGLGRNPISYIVEAADDIVNATVDLEDAVRKRVFSWDWLRTNLLEASGSDTTMMLIIEETESRIANASFKPSSRLEQEVYIQVFRSRVIHRAVPLAIACFQRRYSDIMAGTYTGELTADPSFGPLIKACKKTARFAYDSLDILRLETMGRKVVHDLMDLFWEGVEGRENNKSFARKLYNQMSENYRTVFGRCLETRRMPERYCELRLVTDYIAGMTDTFATDLHRKLTSG